MMFKSIMAALAAALLALWVEQQANDRRFPTPESYRRWN